MLNLLIIRECCQELTEAEELISATKQAEVQAAHYYVLATRAASHGASSSHVDTTAHRIAMTHRIAVAFIDPMRSQAGSTIPNLRSPRMLQSPQRRFRESSVQERFYQENLSSALPPELTRSNTCFPPLLPSL